MVHITRDELLYPLPTVQIISHTLSKEIER